MNEVPPSDDESRDVDDHYRRASARDPSRPSESVRRAVLEHAARLAGEHAANTASARMRSSRPARSRTWWRPAAFGTLAAAVLAGFLIAPRFLTPRAPPRSASAPAQVSAEVQGKAAPSADSAAEFGANNAPANKVQSGAGARSAAAPAARLMDLPAEVRRAAENGNVTELQSLLDNQPVINARDESGRTALMLATLHGQTAAVDALLARGADPNAADVRGMTPLQAAVAGNQPAIVAALQRAGAR